MNSTTGTCSHSTPRSAHVSRAAAILLAALPILAACEQCSAQTVWTAGTSDWFTPSNWTLGVPNAASGTTFDALIANGGTAQIAVLGGSVRRLRVGLVGGPGNLIVDGGTLNVTDDLHLNEGSAGPASMIVQGGSTVTAVDTVVGFNSASNTSFLISGSGTVYNATNDFNVGRLGAGAASLTVDAGALLTSVTSSVAPFSGAPGSNATVTGAGSRWSSTGAFTVGSGVVGTLNIADQGTVHVGTALTIGSTSNVDLNGGTLRFNTATGLNRVNYNSGTIQLAGARNFNTDPAIIAFFGSGPTIPSGKALITEGTARINFLGTTVNGGSLSSLSSIEIGDGGRLTITGGGTVSNVAGGFAGGVSAGSLGEVIVSGAGSTWNNMENLRVGVPGSFNPGRSFVTINDGATVVVAQTLFIVDQSNVNLQGGTIRFDGYSREATSHFNFVRGTVQLAGNRTIGTDAAIADIFGAVPTLGTGKGLSIEGAANVQSPLIIGGGKLKANSLAVSGNGALLFDRGILEIAGGAITGLPSLVVPANGEFRVSGIQTMQVTGAAGSLITATADLALGNAALANAFYTNGALDVGTYAVTLADANDAVFDSGALVTLGAAGSPGMLAATNGMTLDFGGNVAGFGSVDTLNNPAMPLLNNGHITGNSLAEPLTLTGYVKGVGSFDNVTFTGTFSPGLSPTSLQVGSISLSPTSTLKMEIGGTTPGSGYDQLVSSGALTLEGALQVSLLNGFAPTVGQSFNLFDWGTMAGEFNGLQLPSLGGGLTWNVSQLYTAGVLSVAPAFTADFDHDGDVDANDLAVWKGDVGLNADSDADFDGDSDGADFLIWQQQFGSVPAVAVTAAVPEPETLLQLIAAVTGMGLRRRRTRRQLINA